MPRAHRSFFPKEAVLYALVLGLGLVACARPAGAQDARPSDEAILGLQERGHQIASYLAAVDRATDLLKRQGAGTSSDRTVVVQEREGWRVLYLQDTTKSTPTGAASRKGLAVVAETTFSPDAGSVGALGLIVPPRAVASSIQSYASVLAEAEKTVLARPDGGAPLEDAVIREKDGTYTVYVISQRREEGTVPPADDPQQSVLFGRDFVVRLSAGARQVLSTERLHDTVVALSLRPRGAGAPVLHDHDKGDLPSPTDVAQVLRHPVLAPLLVLTQRFMFRIDQEGRVTWLGPNPNPKPAASPAPASSPQNGGGSR
jgi:hypothetical protein